MDKLIKAGIALLLLTIGISAVYLKPIVMNENNYKVVMVNLSEQPVSSITISGAGTNSGKIGPINPGKLRHYIFQPAQDGILEYSVIQNEREIKGIINDNLKKGDTGEIYVQVGEMFKIKVHDELNIPE